jgi:hypothetical protein
MSRSSSPSPGQSDRKYREYYHLAHGSDALPSAAEVEKDLAERRAALEASTRPGDSWLKQFADGSVPSTDEAQHLDAAIQAFSPVLSIAQKQVNFQHASRIEMLERQLGEKQQLISDLESEASEEKAKSEQADKIASHQAALDELRREKYDKQTLELQKAQASIARLQKEKESLIQDMSNSKAEAKVKAEFDEEKFRKLKEQADAMAQEAEKTKAAHESELENIARLRKLDAETWEKNRQLELERVASERESEAETREESRKSELGSIANEQALAAKATEETHNTELQELRDYFGKQADEESRRSHEAVEKERKEAAAALKAAQDGFNSQVEDFQSQTNDFDRGW